MSNMALKVAAAYLTSRDIRFDVVGDNQDIIKTGFNIENKEGGLQILVCFDEDEHSANVKSYNFVKFPAEKKMDMYQVCNSLNYQYRWVKFVVDESDNTVTIYCDTLLQLDCCGEEVMEIINRMASISEKAYPKFMSRIWG